MWVFLHVIFHQFHPSFDHYFNSYSEVHLNFDSTLLFSGNDHKGRLYAGGLFCIVVGHHTENGGGSLQI